jgi:outer membrane biosynthesis protein TonB
MASSTYTPNLKGEAKPFFLVLRDIFVFVKNLLTEFPHISKSFLVHIVIIALLSGFLPKCSEKIEAPKIITVDIMPLSPNKTEKVEKPIPKAEEIEKKVEIKQAPKPVVKTEKPKETKQEAREMEKKKDFVEKTEEVKDKKEEIVTKKEAKLPPVQKPQNTKKTEIKPKVQQKPNEKNDEADQKGKQSLLKDIEKKENLDEIFDSIEKTEAKKATAPKAKLVESANNNNFVPDANFINEISGKIQSQITKCWAVPAGAKNIENMVVTLYISLDVNGYVREVSIIDKYRYNSDNFFRVLADSAVWAVKECSPLQGLPVDKHEFWKEVEFNFDPSKIL